MTTSPDAAPNEDDPPKRRPLLDVRAVVILTLGVVAGWLGYNTPGGWAAAIAAGTAVIALLFTVLP